MPELPERAAAEQRIVERLSSLDDAALSRIETLLAGESAVTPAAIPAPGGVSRRRLLVGGAMGVAALAAGGLGGGAIGLAWGDAQGATRATETAASTRRDLEAEIARLQGLVRLYQNLEKVGIDALLSAAISGLELGLKGLRDAVLAIRKAVVTVDASVSNVEGAFGTLRAGLSLAEGFVSVLRGQLKLMQTAMFDVTGKLSPVTDAVGSFLANLIAKIPFGVGAKILEANTRIGDVLGGLPDALDAISTRLLEPLRKDWLTEDETKGLKGQLLAPIRNDLLKPLASFLGDVAAFLGDLEAKLFGPAKAAIAERDMIRQQIAAFQSAQATP